MFYIAATDGRKCINGGRAMIIVFKPKTSREEIDRVIDKVKSLGLDVHISEGTERTILGAIGDERRLHEASIHSFPGVEEVHPILKPWKLVSRDFQAENTKIDVGGAVVGGEKIQMFVGPCSVESLEQVLEVAGVVDGLGLDFMRGGAFKPRTSPYSFQGLEGEGLELLAQAREKYGLRIVTECMDPRDLPLMEKYADVIQIGTRNMQNFRLLKEAGALGKPVLLKRGLSATVKEWLMAAEYIASEGNRQIILCERGIRTYESETRNTLDLSAVPVLKQLTHLPVIVDPSHAAGRWDLVEPLSLAAVAVGADGLMIEVHPHPEEALCDGDQSLRPGKLKRLVEKLRKVARAVGRTL